MLKQFILVYFFFFSFLYSQSSYTKEIINKKNNIVILKKWLLPYGAKQIITLALKKDTLKRKISYLKTELKNYYEKHGYFQFKLIIKKRQFLNNTTYILKVTSGKQSRISKIIFLGSIKKPSSFYRKIFLQDASPIVKSNIYNPFLIKESLKDFILNLKNRAYLTAKSISIKKNWVSPYKVKLSFIIEEGPLSKVKNIKWKGITNKEKIKLTSLLKVQVNSHLIIKDITGEDLFTIIDFFKDKGYLDVRFKNNKRLIQYDNQQQASLYYQIIKGRKSKLNKVIIKGNKFTKNLTINKAVFIKKGSVITSNDLKDIYFNLENLNIFSEIKVTLNKSKYKKYNKNLLIQVKEKKRTRLNTKLVIQSTQYNSLSTSINALYEKRNIKGTGRKFYTTLQLKNKLNSNILEYKTSLQFNEPFLFYSNINAIVKIETKKDIIDFNPENTEYGLLRNQTALSFRLNKEINKHFSSYWTVLKFNKITETSKGSNVKNTNILNSTSILTTSDFRNSVFNPKKGHYEDFQILYTKPIFKGSENIHFVQLLSNMEYYVPLGRFTWAQQLSLGYAKSLLSTAKSGIPSNFAFFLGGTSSLRGYSGGSDRFPSPQELPLDKNNQLVIKDFTYFYLLKSEFRIPLKEPFYTSIFYDIGSVKVDKLHFYNPIRSSYGLGLHFSTPIGILSLNYGKKINPSPEEGGYAIHLSIGSF
ncbi:MAG: BamA/TamA family outer membrane protein [Bdellovibrionaceae bacterium]|nr:BamA/TamA family outer membrane protein [Pseudobdellovibrionaceae bacterium]